MQKIHSSSNYEKSFFDNLCEKYENVLNRKMYEASSNQCIEFVQKCKAGKIENILDLCCGTGYSTYIIREKFPECNIYGVDISKQMIKVAQSKNVEKKIQFFEMDALEINKLDRKFDLITCNYGMQWLNEDIFHVINEILSDNGLLIISIPGYTLGSIDVNNETQMYVGNKIFQVILKLSVKYKKMHDVDIGKKIAEMWSNTLSGESIKTGFSKCGLVLYDELVKSQEIEFASAKDMVNTIIGRGTFGNVFNDIDSSFVNYVIDEVAKLIVKNKNLKEENITQFMAFRKESYHE